MAKESYEPIGAPDREPERPSLAERLVGPKLIGGGLIVAVAVWFVLVNNSPTRIHFWVVWVTAKLWMVLGGTFLAGLLAGYLLRVRTSRGGRKKKQQQQDD
jgi:hypothetical protein